MEIDKALDYVAANHRAVLATTRRDGSVQMSPVTVDLDAERKVIVSCRETAYKVGHIRREPKVALCVFPDKWLGRWVQIEGVAEIVGLPDAMEGLVAYYRGLRGEHPDWEEYRAAMVADRRLLIRISATRAGPDRQG
jgi:PPOX class probable F420-dependent enzyme